MIKTLKIRLLPTSEQEELFWKHIDCSRYIWNWALAKQEESYKNGEKYISAFTMIKRLPSLKEENPWLKEVSSSSLQTVVRDQEKAYREFFKGTHKHPRFKKRKTATKAYPVRCNSVYFQDGKVNIEKVGKVKYQTNYNVPQGKGCKFTNPRIKLQGKKWILTVGIECENQAVELTDKTMGIDLGVKDLAIVAYGNLKLRYGNINKTKRIKSLERRKTRLQRDISRKYRTNGNWEKTKNIEKLEAQLRKVFERIANIRQNYLHQTTHELTSLLPKEVIMEDLNVSGMMKNRHLSKAIAEQNFAEFIRQMQYKCEWLGIKFTQVDRFYPSSKKCSCCGGIKKDLKLSDRTYICSNCGAVIDRDYNAALNLMRYSVA